MEIGGETERMCEKKREREVAGDRKTNRMIVIWR